MDLDQIKQAIDKLLADLMNMQRDCVSGFDNGFETDENDRIYKSDFVRLKNLAREILQIFNALSELKGKIAKIKKDWYDALEKEVIASKSPLANECLESINQAMDAQSAVDSAVVQACVDGMRACQGILDLLRSIYNDVKDLEMV